MADPSWSRHLNLSDFTVLYYFVVLNICFITGEERFIDIARLKSRGSLLGLGDDDAQHAYSKSRSCCDHFQSGECWDKFRKGHNHRLLRSTTDCCSVWWRIRSQWNEMVVFPITLYFMFRLRCVDDKVMIFFFHNYLNPSMRESVLSSTGSRCGGGCTWIWYFFGFLRQVWRVVVVHLQEWMSTTLSSLNARRRTTHQMPDSFGHVTWWLMCAVTTRQKVMKLALVWRAQADLN